MSNAMPNQTLKLNDRISLPATVTRSTAKFLIADLYGSDAGAFALADNQAARDSFIARCTALALAAMVYGDASRLERMKKYAATLPTYRTDKSGLPTGKLGKLLTAYREAVSLGRALAYHPQIEASKDEVDLSVLASSPVFGALIAPPQAKPKPSAPSAGVTATVAPSAPSAPKAPMPSAEAEAYQQAWLAAEAKAINAAINDAYLEDERLTLGAMDNAAAASVWQRHEAAEAAKREAAEAEAKRQAWLAAKAQEKAKDALADAAIAAMEFIALAEMIGIKLTPAQVKKAQAYAAEQQEKLAA